MANTQLMKAPTLPTPKVETKAAAPVKESFVQAPKATKEPLGEWKSLADDKSDYFKILVFGHTGTGKTKIVVDLLLAGQKVLVISCDTGGHGLSTVKQWLRKLNRLDLLENCRFREFTTYDQVENFVYNPDKAYPGFYEEDFDTLFFDGFSNFQMCHIDDKVMSFTPATNAGDARDAGLWSGQQDWGAIKKATVKIHNKFLQMKNETTGKIYHKIVTCIENKPKEDKLTGETRIGPYLQGAGAALIEPAYDIIFRTRKKKVGELGAKRIEYVYEMEGSDSKVVLKSRAFDLEPTLPGNFGALWSNICSQMGIPTGKR